MLSYAPVFSFCWNYYPSNSSNYDLGSHSAIKFRCPCRSASTMPPLYAWAIMEKQLSDRRYHTLHAFLSNFVLTCLLASSKVFLCTRIFVRLHFVCMLVQCSIVHVRINVHCACDTNRTLSDEQKRKFIIVSAPARSRRYRHIYRPLSYSIRFRLSFGQCFVLRPLRMNMHKLLHIVIVSNRSNHFVL